MIVGSTANIRALKVDMLLSHMIMFMFVFMLLLQYFTWVIDLTRVNILENWSCTSATINSVGIQNTSKLEQIMKIFAKH